MSNHKSLSQDEIAAIVNNETAFRTWAIVKIQSLEKDVSFIKKFLSPSIWAVIIMAIGALAEVLLRLAGH